ncbi:hypothetical protein TNCV_3441631 [Trichonephila clavipes]|nr:hypothetical protein TNCV_3441631 [Trichonephila clavipes]
MLGHTQQDVTRLSPAHYHPTQTSKVPRFIPNQPYLGSFRMLTTVYEFGRTRGTFTASVVREISQVVIQNLLASMTARINRIALEVVQQSTKASVHFYFLMQKLILYF